MLIYGEQSSNPGPPGEKCGLDQEEGGRYVGSTIGLVIGEDSEGSPVNLIVDPGFSTNTAAVIELLGNVGLEPDKVTHVFVSHHHPDHTLNAGLFPNATLVDFWATYKVDPAEARGLLWEDHPDPYPIAPGITVVRTPGHTYEDASLIVETGAANQKVVFTHVWWFYSDGGLSPVGPAPEQDPIADDQLQLEASRTLIENENPRCIIPGHGAPFKPNSGGPCSHQLVTDLSWQPAQ